jgi:hypothetical protein
LNYVTYFTITKLLKRNTNATMGHTNLLEEFTFNLYENDNTIEFNWMGYIWAVTINNCHNTVQLSLSMIEKEHHEEEEEAMEEDDESDLEDEDIISSENSYMSGTTTSAVDELTVDFHVRLGRAAFFDTAAKFQLGAVHTTHDFCAIGDIKRYHDNEPLKIRMELKNATVH